MNRRIFLLSGLTALAGIACRNVQIGDLANRSPRYDVLLSLDEAVQEIAQKKIAAPIIQAIGKPLPADTDLAFVCLENETGNILAYIPTVQKNREFDNCRQAKRGIASTIKPFIYGIALESGAVRADETFLDAPAEFPRLDGGGTYSVDNYKNQYLMRELNIEEAIAVSSNVIAMRVYHRINQDVLREFLKKLSFPPEYNRNLLPLGLYAVPPLDAASRATAFARGGSFVMPRFVSEIKSGDETKRKIEPVNISEQVFSPSVCQIISRAMQRCAASGTAATAKDISGRVRAKTGSSSDSLCIYQSKATTSFLWIGQSSTNADLQISGGKLAAPRLADFYRALLKTRSNLMPIWN